MATVLIVRAKYAAAQSTRQSPGKARDFRDSADSPGMSDTEIPLSTLNPWDGFTLNPWDGFTLNPWSKNGTPKSVSSPTDTFLAGSRVPTRPVSPFRHPSGPRRGRSPDALAVFGMRVDPIESQRLNLSGSRQ